MGILFHMWVPTQTKRKTNRHDHKMRNMVTGTLAHWPCVQIERDHIKVCYEYLNSYLRTHTHTRTWVLTQVVSCMNTYKHTHTSWHLHRPYHTFLLQQQGPSRCSNCRAIHTNAHLRTCMSDLRRVSDSTHTLCTHPSSPKHTSTHMHHEER